jgi:hypothetical protein
MNTDAYALAISQASARSARFHAWREGEGWPR